MEDLRGRIVEAVEQRPEIAAVLVLHHLEAHRAVVRILRPGPAAHSASHDGTRALERRAAHVAARVAGKLGEERLAVAVAGIGAHEDAPPDVVGGLRRRSFARAVGICPCHGRKSTAAGPPSPRDRRSSGPRGRQSNRMGSMIRPAPRGSRSNASFAGGYGRCSTCVRRSQAVVNLSPRDISETTP
jgi:hypothetical protein